MTTIEMKTQIHEYIEQANDELVAVIHTILNQHITQKSDTILGYSTNGEPIRAEEALERYEKSVKEFEAGNLLLLKNWRRKTLCNLLDSNS